MKLRHKTIIFITPFIIIPILMISFIAFYKLNQSSEKQLKTQINSFFDRASQYMINKEAATNANLLLLSDHPLVKKYALVDDESIRYNLIAPHLFSVFQNLEKSTKEYYEIRFILPNGYEDIRWARNGIKNKDNYISKRNYFDDFLNTKELTKSYLIFDENIQEYALLFLHKLIMNDPAVDAYNTKPKLRGYLAITVNLKHLNEQINKNIIGKNGFFTVTNNQGKPIFLPEQPQEETPQEIMQFLTKDFPVTSSENTTESFIFNNDQFFVFSKKLRSGLNILAFLPEKDILDSGHELGKFILIITVFIIFLASFFVFVALRHLILKPLATLNSAADAIGNGQHEMVVDIKRNDEIGHLAQTFLKMSKNLQRTHDEATHAANHDTLTGLPNRSKFQNHLSELIKQSKFKNKFALLFIDLDNFKQINDSMGHHAGDILLQELASRFTSILRKQTCNDDAISANCENIVARLGGDEFIIVLNNIDGPWDASAVAERLFKTLQEPVSVLDKQIYASCSIGITLYPDDAINASELVKNGDVAMYHAKSEGKNHFQFYSEKQNSEMYDALQMNTRLRVALEESNFTLKFQPKFDLKTNQIVGFEALLRWYDSELGVVSPSQFIPIAEESGLITPMTEWVIQEVCKQCMQWHREGLMIVPVSINISSIQFKRRDLIKMFKDCMKKTGLLPSYIEIEITETSLLTNTDECIQILNELNKMNVTVALDDFGTGYSSLGYLNNLPINILKIDRSFVNKIKDINKDYAIIDAIIALAHTLDMKVVAEGVESNMQLEYLKSRHCDMVQGFFLGKPVSGNEVTQLLHNIINIDKKSQTRYKKSG